MPQDLLILGAGGHGRVVAEIARSAGFTGRIAFLDDGKKGPDILGKSADFAQFQQEFPAMFPAIGNNAIRKMCLIRLLEAGVHVPALIHPSAFVSPSAVIGPGTVIEPKAIVNTHARIGSGCILGLGTIVDHDVTVENNCHLNSGSIVQAGCSVPELTRLDSGCVFTKNGIR